MGTAFEDLAGVEVGETLFVGEPWKNKQTKNPPDISTLLHILRVNKNINSGLIVCLTFVGDLKQSTSRRNY